MVIDQGMVANVNIKYQLKMVYIFHALRCAAPLLPAVYD